MNDSTLLNRLAEANAHSQETPLPDIIWTRARSLREIERKLGMETSEHGERFAHGAGATEARQTTRDAEVNRRGPRRLSGVWVAAAVAALVLITVGGAFALITRGDEFDAAAVKTVVDDYWAAVESGDVETAIAQFSPTATWDAEVCGGSDFDCTLFTNTITDSERLLTWKAASGTVYVNRSCSTTSASEAEVTVRCEYGEREVATQPDAPSVPVVATYVVGPDGILSLQRQVGPPDYIDAQGHFHTWARIEHPDDAASAECCDFESVDQARQAGVLYARYALEWAAFLETTGCAYNDFVCFLEASDEATTEPLQAPASDAGLISPDQWTIAASAFNPRTGEVDAPADALERIRGWAEVIDVVEVPPTSDAWVAVTGIDTICAGAGLLPCEEGVVVLLQPDADAPSIAARLETELNMNTLLAPWVVEQFVSDYVAGFGSDRAHPKPAFDTSALGAELTLVDLTDSPVLPPHVTEPTEFARSWFVAAALDGTDASGYFWIETDPDEPWGVGPRLRLEVVPDSTDMAGSGMGGGMDHGETIGYSNDGVFAIGLLPAATSVVAAVMDDGTRFWQRPIGGLAVFEATAGRTGQFVALDESGAQLLAIPFGGEPGHYPARPDTVTHGG